MTKTAPLGGKLFTKPFLFLLGLVAMATVLIIIRLIYGLGETTNLNNGYPWGLWVIFDIHVTAAMGCGGYVLAVIVYITNRGEFHPMVRPAIVGSAFAYTLANIAAFVDLGRWWNFYQIGLPWNFNLNSVMFEIAYCMLLYTIVLWIEFMPAVLEKFGLQRYLKTFNKTLFVIVAFGIVLPTMHQSSLGAVIVAAGEKISPLWQTTWIPFLFLASAITMGFAIIIFEGALSALGFKRPLELAHFKKLADILRWVLAIYLIVRFGDLIYRGELGLVFTGDTRGTMFIVENLLFLAPLLILSQSSLRSSPRALFLAATSLVLAAATLRFNALLVGFNAPSGYQYFPSIIELLVSIGMLAIEVVGFIYIVKRFPILPTSSERGSDEAPSQDYKVSPESAAPG